MWPPYELPFLARDLGRYSPREIQLVDFRTPGVVQAYRNGVIDVVAVTLDEGLRIAAADPEQRIVLVIDFSNGGDSIVARRGIATLAQLRGARIGAPNELGGAYLLRRALEEAHLAPGDVLFVPTEVADGEEALTAGRVDAVLTYEPTRSLLLSRGAVELFSSASIPGEIVDVLMVRRPLLEARHEALQSFVNGWFGALEDLTKRPAEALQSMSRREGLSPAELSRTFAAVSIPDLAENRRLLGGSPPALRENMTRLQVELARMGYARRPFDTSSLLDDRFVRAVTP